MHTAARKYYIKSKFIRTCRLLIARSTTSGQLKFSCFHCNHLYSGWFFYFLSRILKLVLHLLQRSTISCENKMVNLLCKSGAKFCLRRLGWIFYYHFAIKLGLNQVYLHCYEYGCCLSLFLKINFMSYNRQRFVNESGVIYILG